MSYCDDCVDYDHKTKKCIPSGEDAGESVITCLSKRFYISNGDRIRNMEDDELAIWLCETVKVCAECFAEEFCKPTGEQANGMLEWLKQEAAE